MGGAADEMQGTIEQVVALQERDMFDDELLGWIVGTDKETELAGSLGVVLHPLPPAPNEIMAWTQQEVDDWSADILTRLQTIEAEYGDLAESLEPLRDEVPEAGRNVRGEVVDGIEMFSLRAGHQWRAYGALVMLRDSQLSLSTTRAAADAQRLDAIAVTEAARAAVARREQGHRYAPLSRSIAGGPDGDQDSNWTTYSCRYLNRTHHVFSYTYVDELVEETFAGAADALAITDALLGPTESLTVRVIDPELTGHSIDYGDMTMASGLASYVHDYAAPGTHDVSATGTRGADPDSLDFSVAEVGVEYNSGFGATVVEPGGAAIIEGVLPGLVFGRTTAGRRAGPVQIRGDMGTDSIIDGVVAAGSGAFNQEGATSLGASLLGYTVDTLPPTVSAIIEFDL